MASETKVDNIQKNGLAFIKEVAKYLGAEDYWVKANYKPDEVVERVKKIVQKDK